MIQKINNQISKFSSTVISYCPLWLKNILKRFFNAIKSLFGIKKRDDTPLPNVDLSNTGQSSSNLNQPSALPQTTQAAANVTQTTAQTSTMAGFSTSSSQTTHAGTSVTQTSPGLTQNTQITGSTNQPSGSNSAAQPAVASASINLNPSFPKSAELLNLESALSHVHKDIAFLKEPILQARIFLERVREGLNHQNIVPVRQASEKICNIILVPGQKMPISIKVLEMLFNSVAMGENPGTLNTSDIDNHMTLPLIDSIIKAAKSFSDKINSGLSTNDLKGLAASPQEKMMLELLRTATRGGVAAVAIDSKIATLLNYDPDEWDND